MPVYIGKSMDTFEDVWNMWMKYAGVDDLIPADVMSFRCFACSFGEDIRKWFSPAQPVRCALEELCDNLGIKEVCTIIPASVWKIQPCELEWPILLADVCLGVEIPIVRDKFYQGISPFCLLYRHSDGRHLVYSSSGAPFIEMTEKQVMEKTFNSKGYVLTGKMPMQIQRLPAKRILHKGMQWRRDILNNQWRKDLCCPDIFNIEWDRISSLSVRYGLMNYQIQLSKVVKFCVQEIQVPSSVIDELDKILLRIGSVFGSCAYEKIAEIDRDFWALIKNIEESSHV